MTMDAVSVALVADVRVAEANGKFTTTRRVGMSSAADDAAVSRRSGSDARGGASKTAIGGSVCGCDSRSTTGTVSAAPTASVLGVT